MIILSCIVHILCIFKVVSDFFVIKVPSLVESVINRGKGKVRKKNKIIHLPQIKTKYDK